MQVSDLLFITWASGAVCSVLDFPLWTSHYKTDIGLLEQVQPQLPTTELDRRLEHRTCKERLRELRLLSLERRNSS